MLFRQTYILNIFISILVLLTGCQNEHSSRTPIDIRFNDFNNTVHETGKVILNDDSIAVPSDITFIDSLLFMRDAKGPPFIHAYDLDTKKLYSFGREGQGPNELMGGVWEISNVQKENLFRVFSLSSRRVYICKIDFILNGRDNICSMKTRLTGGGIPLRVDMSMRDSIVASGIYKDRIAIYKADGSLRNVFGNIPNKVNIKDGENLPNKLISKAYESLVDVNKSNGKVIAASKFSDRIDIYDFNKQDPITVIGPNNLLPTFSVLQGRRLMHNKSTISAYMDVVSYGDKIFALFKGYVEGREGRYDSIHIFGISGKPIGNIELSSRLNSITIGPNQEFLYATSIHPKPRVLRIPIRIPSQQIKPK